MCRARRRPRSPSVPPLEGGAGCALYPPHSRLVRVQEPLPPLQQDKDTLERSWPQQQSTWVCWALLRRVLSCAMPPRCRREGDAPSHRRLSPRVAGPHRPPQERREGLLAAPVSRTGLFGSLTTVTQRLKRLEEEKAQLSWHLPVSAAPPTHKSEERTSRRSAAARRRERCQNRAPPATSTATQPASADPDQPHPTGLRLGPSRGEHQLNPAK